MTVATLHIPRTLDCTQLNFAFVTYLIEENKLYGKGIGYIDTHILASSMLSTIPLWTLDKRLDAISKNLTIPQ